MTQEKLIWVSKKNKILLVFILSLGLCCTTNRQNIEKQEVFLQVDFQENFENDNIGLKFNNCVIFAKEQVETFHPVGFTKLRVTIAKDRKKNYKVTYYDQTITCRYNGKVIKLFVELNGNVNEFLIDRALGKYIGFSKENDKRLGIRQQELPYLYE